jgi:SAM-dependent methyltransferase
LSARSYAGALKIVRYNWPWYAAALAANAALIWGIGAARVPSAARFAAAAGLGAADFWLCASLAVSHYVYDLSPLARAAWLDGVADGARRAAVFHLGADEASAAVAARFPSAELSVVDVFDPARHRAPSLARARALAPSADGTIAAAPERLPAPDGTLDLACAVFAAHELRDEPGRAAFFRELRRALSPRGRVLVVEHLRDAWNAAAYGPGVFHFQSRETWLKTFADADLTVARESRCTPFVAVFELSRGA